MSTIRVELQLADGTFTTGMLRAGQTIEQFNKQLQRLHPQMDEVSKGSGVIYTSMARADTSTRTFLGTLRDASVVMTAFSMGMSGVTRVMNGWARDIINVNSEIENLKVLMASMSNASDPIQEAADNVQLLMDKAYQAPFALNALTNGFVKLKATGIDPLNGSLDAIVDGVAAFGGGEDELNRVMLGISQMAGKGVIQMEEMRQQLGESMPRAMELMARSMSMSIAELVDAIGTGRVESEHALNALFREIEITFGGSAARMMQTWTGKVSQAQTALQKLSLIAGDEFFEEFKGHLDAINDFLGSATGEEMAKSVGSALATVGGMLRSLVETVYNFREQLTLVGRVMAIAFAGRTLVSGVDQAARSIAQLSTGITVIRASINSKKLADAEAAVAAKTHTSAVDGETAAIARQNQQLAQNTNLKNANNMASQKGTGVAAAGVAGVAGGLIGNLGRGATALSRFASVASGALGWVGLLGSGIILLADNMGVFESKADRAVSALENFNGASREQLAEVVRPIDAMIEEQQRMLDYQEARLAQAKKNLAQNQEQGSPSWNIYNWLNSVTSGGKNDFENLIDEAEESVAELRGELLALHALKQGAEQRYADAVTRKRISELEAGLNKELEVIQTSTDARRRALANNYAQELTLASANEGDTAAVKQKYQEDNLQSQLEFYNNQIEILENHYQKARIIRGSDEKAEQEAQRSWTQILLQKLAEFTERRNAILENGLDGIKLLPETADENAVFDDAEKALDKLKGNLFDVGADGDDVVAILMRLDDAIAKQKFGTIKEGADKFKQLRAQISQSYREQKRLNELVDGRKDFNERLAGILQENAERIWEAQRKVRGLDTSDADKLDWEYQNGAFEALVDLDALDEETRQAVLKLQELDQAARRARNEGFDQAFGAETVGMITSTAGAIKAVRDEIGLLTGSLGGLSFDQLRYSAVMGGSSDLMMGRGMFVPAQASSSNASVQQSMLQAMHHYVSNGYSPTAAAGIVGNFFGESTMNPRAINPGDGSDGSDSIGYGQWNQDRSINLKRLAASRGVPWYDAQTQLDHSIIELNGRYSGVRNKLTMAGTPEEAVEVFMRGYEVPSEKSMNESRGRRQAAAREALALFNGSGGVANASAIPDAQGPVKVELTPNSVAAVGEEFVKPSFGLAKDLKNNPVTTSEGATTGIGIAKESERRATAVEKEVELSTAITDLKRAIEVAKTDGVDVGATSLERAREEIAKGTYGESKSITAEEYKELLVLAKQYDDLVKAIDEKEDAREDSIKTRKQLIEDEQEMTARAAELHRKLLTGADIDDSSYRALSRDLDEYIDNVKKAYGTDKKEYEDALNYKRQILGQFRMNENLENQIASQERTRSITDSLMNETQARRAAMERELAILDARIAAVDMNEAGAVELVRQYEMEKAAIRQQFADQTDPMASKMREWTDLQGNLANMTSKWLDSTADGITNLIMGTGDLKSVINGMLKDMVNMSVKFLMGNMFGGGSKGGGGKAAGAKGGEAKAVGKLFGVFHTGGIVGGRSQQTMVNPSVFAGARKYHTGGIVGDGRKLLPGEVPIIAKEGEGVFTPDQMKALGGTTVSNQSVSISAPVTVNASGGSPEQNADLASKISDTLETKLKGMIAEQLIVASRPGNFANSRTR